MLCIILGNALNEELGWRGFFFHRQKTFEHDETSKPGLKSPVETFYWIILHRLMNVAQLP